MNTTAYEALAAKLTGVTAERDRARATAVALEQEAAHHRAEEWELIDSAGITWQSRARRLASRLREAEAKLARVEALDLPGELREIRSFIWVETRHEPTRAHVAALIDSLDAALNPEVTP